MHIKLYKTVLFLCFSIILPFSQAFSLEHANNLENYLVSVKFENITLKDALNRIKKSVPVSFAYNEKEVNVGIRVSGNFNKTPFPEVLDHLLVSNGYLYKEQDRIILVSPAPKPEKPVPKGGVRGKVYDAATGETLVGASIIVEGTTRGTTTDMKGQYVLSGLEPGNYTIVASFVSYQKKKFTNIRVTSGNNTLLDVPLNPASENISEVEVVGRIDVKTAPIRNMDEASLISTIRASDLMVTGISSEQISKSLDSDAGDVIKRAPGVSVLNEFTIVRGMAPRYTQTFINGMQILSTENFQRAVSLEIVPAGVINSINIYKLPAPELPGGFGGGIIKIETKQSQAARRIEVSLSGEYNTGYSFTDLYTGSISDNKDWLASGVSAREFPSAIYAGDKYSLPDEKMYPDERMKIYRQFKTNDLTQKFYRGNISGGINYYDSWLIGPVRINNLTAAYYSNKTEFKTLYRKYFAQVNPETGGMSAGQESKDSITSEKVRINGLESLHVILNPDHKITVNVLANRNATNVANFRHFVNENSNSGSLWLSDALAKDVRLGYGYTVDDILCGQVRGEHRLGKHYLEWHYGQSYFRAYTPLLENYTFDTGAYLSVFSSPELSKASKSFFRAVDKGRSGGIDYTYDLAPNSKLKLGGLITTQHRKATSADYHLYRSIRYSTINQLTGTRLWEQLSETFRSNYQDDLSGIEWDQISGTDKNYYYDLDVSAAYLAWKQSFSNNKFQVYGGVRYEYEKALLYDKDKKPITEFIYATSDGGHASLKLDTYKEYWLPSLYLTWNIDDRQRVKAGYGKTLDRPFAREKSFHEYYSPEEGMVYQGNRTLQNATIDNADLRWEFYPSESEFIAVGAFYKQIDKPIEAFEWESEGSYTQYSANYRQAKLAGIEVEARKNLGFIPISWTDRFSAIANFTYTHTKIDESYFTKSTAQWTTYNEDSERPLTGSSPVILNANLYYTDPKLRTQLALNYNYTGKLLLNVGDNDYGNLYQDPHGQLDFTAIQPIGKYLKVKAGIRNIFKKDLTGWLDKDFDGKKHLDEEALLNGGSDTDIGDAYRVSTDRKIYLGLTFSF